jgi:hypothetical protein
MGLDARTKRTASKLDDVLEKALQEHENSSENNDGEAGDLLDDCFLWSRRTVRGLSWTGLISRDSSS